MFCSSFLAFFFNQRFLKIKILYEGHLESKEVHKFHQSCFLMLQLSPVGALAPVYVYIYGGAFLSGAGYLYGPDPMVAEGIVVVTFNYRLGALGNCLDFKNSDYRLLRKEHVLNS